MTRLDLSPLLFAAACGLPPSAYPPSNGPDPTGQMVDWTQARTPPHGSASRSALDAVLFDNVTGFREAISVLRREFPLQSGNPVADQATLLAALDTAARANTTTEAALSLGKIGVACSGCHSASHVMPSTNTQWTPSGDGVRVEMARHDAAIDALWIGVIAASPERMSAAADAFARSFLRPQTGEPPAAATALDESVTRLARSTATAPSQALRAEAFGDVLLSCAACHRSPPPGLIGEPD